MSEQGKPAKYGGDWSSKLGERVGPDCDHMCWEVTHAEYYPQQNITMVAFTPIPEDVLTYGSHAAGTHGKDELRYLPTLCGPHHHHRADESNE